MLNVLLVTRISGLEEELRGRELPGIRLTRTKTDGDTREAIAGMEVLVADPVLVAPHLELATSLRWLQSTFAGVDAVFWESNRYASTVRITSEALTETLIAVWPRSSRVLTFRRALSTSASAVTPPAFSRISFSSDPALTPTRTGMALPAMAATISRTFAAPPMFPGLILKPAAPASTALMASL